MPISTVRIYKHSSHGFTLLELMIVLGIAAAVVALALPRFTSQNGQLRQALRKLASVTRELQSTAKLQGAVYRLAIDLNSGYQSKDQSYWIEKATSKTVLSPDEMKASEEMGAGAKSSDENPAPPLFSEDNHLIKGHAQLPGDLKFEDVELRRFDQPIKTGIAYIHFFPQGLAEEAVIHLRASDKLRWTFSIHPLTGKSAVATQYISFKELVGQ